jgi:ADP-dependent phosphofructokinase/glucokinase
VSTPADAVEAALTALRDVSAFLAYNANVDAIVRVDEEVEAALPPPAPTATTPLSTPEDLSAALAAAVRAGEGDEMRLDDDFGAWLASHLDPDVERLGGQAGHATDLLSVLGADVVLYTYLLSDRQRSLFHRPGAVRFPVVRGAVDGGSDGDGDAGDGGTVSLVPATEAPLAGETKRNWIFEFADGATFHGATAPAESRFIAASRPEAFDLDAGALAAHAGAVGEAVDCALLSGYHSLKERYDDGRSYRDQIEVGASFLRDLRAGNDLRVQIEYGVTHMAGLREAILDSVFPHADAVGVDARELRLLASDLGLPAGTEVEVVDQYERCRAVLDRLPIACLKLHATDYFLAVTDGDYLPPGAVRRGFDFASVVAATKAARGAIGDPDDLRTGLDVDRSAEGRAAVRRLADALGAPEADATAGGVPSLATPGVVAHPNRVVADPVGTVGIGDLVSAASFALENAVAGEPARTPGA